MDYDLQANNKALLSSHGLYTKVEIQTTDYELLSMNMD